MDLLPLRAAAGNGSVDGLPAAQLVAAGFTLLQRSAPLVRALAGRRSAILLPNSAHFLTALAASDGRGAVLIPPSASAAEVAALVAGHNVGVVFTLAALADRLLDPTAPRVLLDGSPATARVILTPHADRHVDLGSHFGLELSGDDATPGRDEECVLIAGHSFSHRDLLADASAHRHTGAEHRATRAFTTVDGLVQDLLAPLIAGAHVATA